MELLTKNNQAVEAKEYWADCTNTHLASEEYYRSQKALLAQLAAEFLRPSDRVADYGCGNGTFTLELARFCQEITGYDLSPHLIAEARQTAHERGARNAAFSVLDIEQGLPEGCLDSIACLGVFSTILKDGVFERTIDQLAERIVPGGYLFLRESVARKQDHQVTHDSGYTGRYRLLDDYLATVIDAGFRERFGVENFHLEDQDIVNWTWVFQRR